MQKSSSRGGYSKKAALEAEFLHRQLRNADLIKRLKVCGPLRCARRTDARAPYPRLIDLAGHPRLQVVTETLEQYSDDDDDVERAKSGTVACRTGAARLFERSRLLAFPLGT